MFADRPYDTNFFLEGGQNLDRLGGLQRAESGGTIIYSSLPKVLKLCRLTGWEESGWKLGIGPFLRTKFQTVEVGWTWKLSWGGNILGIRVKPKTAEVVFCLGALSTISFFLYCPMESLWPWRAPSAETASTNAHELLFIVPIMRWSVSPAHATCRDLTWGPLWNSLPEESSQCPQRAIIGPVPHHPAGWATMTFDCSVPSGGA